jgi:hypothetical protein
MRSRGWDAYSGVRRTSISHDEMATRGEDPDTRLSKDANSVSRYYRSGRILEMSMSKWVISALSPYHLR